MPSPRPSPPCAAMADYTRVETPGVGRSLVHRAGTRSRTLITDRPGGYYVSMEIGMISPSAVALADALTSYGRTVPTDSDLAWLRGEQ